MRLLIALLACSVLAAGEARAVIGQAAPVVGGVPSGMALAVYLPHPDDLPPAAPDGVAPVVLAVADAAPWFGAEALPPVAALVGADGILLWRGLPEELDAAWARERAGGYARERLALVATLRVALRERIADESDREALPRALGLAGQILAQEPGDEEALRLRLDLARHLGERDLFRDTLATLPLARIPARLANELAWERATDEDLAWRMLDQALRLGDHALAQRPEDAGIVDTHARLRYLLGDLDGAVAAQLRAVALAPDDESLRDALDYYRDVLALRDAQVRGRRP